MSRKCEYYTSTRSVCLRPYKETVLSSERGSLDLCPTHIERQAQRDERQKKYD